MDLAVLAVSRAPNSEADVADFFFATARGFAASARLEIICGKIAQMAAIRAKHWVGVRIHISLP